MLSGTWYFICPFGLHLLTNQRTWSYRAVLRILGVLRNVETACRCILDAVEVEDEQPVDFVVVNPFHHVNTSVIFETALLHPNARVHLIDRSDIWQGRRYAIALLLTQAPCLNRQRRFRFYRMPHAALAAFCLLPNP